jgi:hypothetical protein
VQFSPASCYFLKYFRRYLLSRYSYSLLFTYCDVRSSVPV